MGICGFCSNPEEQRNKEINEAIKSDKKKQGNEVKILLLGAGESGKSTLIKQVKIIHDKGFSEETRNHFKEILYSNLYANIDAMIKQADIWKLEVCMYIYTHFICVCT